MSGERPASEQANSSKDSVKDDEAGDGGQEQPHDFPAPAGAIDFSKVNESLREHHTADSPESDKRTTTAETIVSDATIGDQKPDDVPKNTLPSGIHNFTWSLVRNYIRNLNLTVADPSKPLRKKAKIMRLERRLEKLAQKVPDGNQEVKSADIAKKARPENVEKTLDQLISDVPENSVHKLKV